MKTFLQSLKDEFLNVEGWIFTAMLAIAFAVFILGAMAATWITEVFQLHGAQFYIVFFGLVFMALYTASLISSLGDEWSRTDR